MNASDEQEKKTIQIDDDLYDQIREYCDENGIRLIAFIEDALTNAIDLNEEVKYLEEAEKLISEVRDERERAYRRGYRTGLMAGFFAANGQLGVSITGRASERELREGRFRAVDGGQLELFS